ncbi:hypothetical protein KA344_21220 [bacterium]|nr:hypothetical protein [bacterium]
MAANETISREQFASLVLKLISEYSDDQWRADLDQFSLITSGAGGPKSLSLARFYQVYLESSSPDNLLALQRQIRLLTNPAPLPTNRNDLLARLLPCLRTLSGFQTSNLKARAMAPPDTSSGELVFFPYADVLAIGLVFDKGETVQHARHFELERIGLDAEAAIDIAVQNLKQLSLDSMRPVQHGFYTSPWKDTYDGCRLLLPEIFSKLSVQGEVVALSAAADNLFVTGSEDIVGLELMTTLGAALMKCPSGVSALPLVLRDGAWESFQLAVDHPAFDTINTYRQNVLRMLYKEQEALLQQSSPAGRRTTITPFVFDHDRERGFLFSKTSVLDGSVNVIPETDVVEFFKKNWLRQEECVARASLARVTEILASKLTKDPILQPGRWYLNEFPSAAELAALGKMPPEQSPLVSAKTSFEETDLSVFELLVSLPIPMGATPTNSTFEKPNTQVCEFIYSGSVSELQEFYLSNLRIGGFNQLETEQGAFFETGLYGAGCTREVTFGPSKIRGESLLRLVKRVNYDTLATRNALIKQSAPLQSLEQFFGLSIPEDTQIKGEFRTSDKSGSQYLLSNSSPEELVRFFRTQLLGPRPICMGPDRVGSPHILMDIKSGITILVAAKPTAEGTLVTLSRDWVPDTKT